MSDECPNCGAGLRKTGNPGPGNTPEVSCPECWWNSTPYVPLLRPDDQGENLSRGEARRRAER